jgi:hypothetical protein
MRRPKALKIRALSGCQVSPRGIRLLTLLGAYRICDEGIPDLHAHDRFPRSDSLMKKFQGHFADCR